MLQPKTSATEYNAQLGLPDKGRAIKWLVVCNDWDLEPLDLLNGLTLGCYQPSSWVLFIPQETLDNKLGPDRLGGPKALDPNYCRQPTL